MKSRRSDPTCAKESVLFQILLSLIHLSVIQMEQMRNHEGHEEHEAVRILSYFLMRVLRSPCCPHYLCSVWITLYSFQRKRQKSMPLDVFYLIFLLTKKRMTTTYSTRCPFGLNRESRVNRERSRRCDRGQASQNATSPQDRWGKARRANDPGVRIPALRVRHFSAVNTGKVLSSGREERVK